MAKILLIPIPLIPCNFSKRFITQSNREDREPREPRRPRKEHSDYVTINVSGVVFKTKQETLARFPETLLGVLIMIFLDVYA